MHRSIRTGFVLALTLLTALTAALPAWAQEAAKATVAPLEALPAATVLAGQWSLTPQTIDQLRQQTQLGALLLQRQRWDELKAHLATKKPDQWQQLQTKLQQRGLKVDDLLQLAQGQAGFAVALPKRPDGRPLPVALFWLEPGAELAGKLLAAARAQVQDEQVRGQKLRAQDLTLAGHKVLQILQPRLAIDPETQKLRMPQNAPSMTPEQFQAYVKEQQDKMKLVAPEAIDQEVILVAQVGNRLLTALKLPLPPEEYWTARRAGQEIELDKFAGVEVVQQLMQQWLAGQPAGQKSLSQRVAQVPGIAQAMPKGTPLLQVYSDMTAMAQMVNQRLDQQKAGLGKALGLEGLQVAALQLTLDGPSLRSGGALIAPAPRQGLLKLLDQQPLPAEPPAWVPANVQSYSLVSFDLGQAYSVLRQIALDQGGEQAQMSVQMLEMQVTNMLQTDPATLLSGLGNQHNFVTYPAPVPAANDQAPPTQPFAVVWQPRNMQLWQNVVQMIGTIVGQGAGAPLQEQGFTGWQIPLGEMMSLSLLSDKQYLVVGAGQDVTKKLLPNLTAPPAGDAALRSSPLLQKASALFKPQAGVAYSISNLHDYLPTLRALMQQAMSRGIEEAASKAGRPVDPAEAAEIQTLFDLLVPPAEQLRGAMGAAISNVTISDQGAIMQGALELPPPAKK